ncbi:MAG: hypothetical protein ACIARR_12650 [Phycisphaerales bacterium JB059]
MKLKGINPIERNIEKIVLGVVFVALLGALAMQFLVQPNRVQVDGNRTIPPQDIYLALADEAEALRGKIDDSNPELPSVPETDLQERFVAGRRANASGVDRLALVTAPGVDVLSDVDVDPGSAVATGGAVVTPRAPAPVNPVAYAQWGVIDPFTLAQHSELSSFVPSGQPYDLASVSVEAVFSGTELGEMLASGNETLRPIPGAWRRNVELVGIEIERQRRLDDGTWGESEPATPPPGAFNALGDVNLESADLSDVLDAASSAARNRQAVVQPRPTGVIAGPVWDRPTRAMEIAAQLSEPNSLPRLRLDLARAEQALRELEDRQAAQSDRQRPTGRTGSGGGEGGRLGEAGAGRPSASRPSQQRPTGLEGRIRETQDNIRELQGRIAEAERELEDARDAEQNALDLPLFELSEIRIWGHDIGVTPGEAYRYRIRAVINNPLYRKGAQLDPDDDAQQSLAREPLVHGAWSDWTEPVMVGARTQYFVTNASSDSRLGRSGSQATFDVYHMFYGHYRSDRALLEPGDAVHVRVGVPQGFVTFDEEGLSEEDMRKYITSQAAYGEELPEGIEWTPTELDVSVPAYLLDVSELPLTREGALGKQEVIRQVVIRTPDGRLEVRRPSEEVAQAGYEAARASATGGQVMDLRLPEATGVARRAIGPGPRPIFGGEGGEGGRVREGP